MLSDLDVLEIGETVSAGAAGTMLGKFGAHATWLRRRPSGGSPGEGRTQRDRLLQILAAGKDEAAADDPWSDAGLSLARDADITIADISSSDYWRDPGWLDAYGESVQRHNRAVWVTISPFGLHGSLRACRGGELVSTAAGGIAYYMRSTEDRPMKPAGFGTSIAAGHFAALAAMHGTLLWRERQQPVHLDLSIQDSVVVTGVFLECSHVLFDCSREGASKNYSAPVGLIRCSNGFVWITVLEQHHWEGCVRAVGSPPWATAINTRDLRYERSEEIRRRLDDWASSLTAQECAGRLQAEGVPATTVNSCADLLGSEGLDVTHGFFVPGARGTKERLPGLPIRLTERTPAATSPPPKRRPRLLDVSMVLVAPLATSWLGTMGVDVLKVEDTSRTDVYRRTGPFVNREPNPEASAYFAFANYSKRSHAVDLDDPAGQERLGELVSTADVVVTNVSRHRAARLGVTTDALDAAGGPTLVACSGFGSTTAHAGYRAYGLNIQGAGAVVHLTRDRAGQPTNFGTSWADPLASVWIAMSAMAQLLAPEERRRHAEIAMVEAVACQFPEYFSEVTLTGVEHTGEENRLDHAAPHGIYRCIDESQWLALSVETDAEWERLLDALGRPPALADPRFASMPDRLAGQDALDRALEGVLGESDRDKTFALLQGVGVACSPAWGARELVELRHVRERDILQTVRHPVWGERRLAGLPWRIVGEGSVPIGVTPTLGQHTSADPAGWWRPEQP